jgi:hypothetical protein
MKKLLPALAVIAGILFMASCGSQGCSCSQPIKGGYPVAERHEGAIQVRATQSLFDFFTQNGATILPKLLPGGTTFNVPPQCNLTAGTKICCAMPAPMCRIQITFVNVKLQPTAPSTIQLDADIQLKTLDNLPANIIGGTCYISIDTTRVNAPTMHVSAPIALPVDQTTDLTQVTIDPNAVTITGLDAGDIKTDESGSTPFLCTGVGFLTGLIAPLLESQVSSQLSGVVSGQTCMKCMTKDDCNAFASDCKSGQCVDGMGNCIQELGVESKIDVGAALASFAPGTQASMDIIAAAGGWSVADTGLSLGMLGGGRGDPHSSCVPMTPAPSPAAIPPSTTFFTNVLPDGAVPYHLGIGVHKSELDSLGWGAFDGGALCLHIGTPQVALLSTKTVGLIIPSLADLVHVADAPIYLSLRPLAAPTFTLDKGTFKADGSVDDPLMVVSMHDFGIDFFALVDERYIRVMTLTADLSLPVSLDTDDQGRLVPLLGDVTSAFTNLRVTNSELLAESPDDLVKAFPTLLSVAVGNLTSALKPIALPAIMGLQITPKAITTTDPDANGQRQFLSIFADLAAATPLERAADTEAHLVRLSTPSTDGFSVTQRSQIVPEAVIALSGRSIDRLPLEYSWNLDGGLWSPFFHGSEITVRDPRLWLQGKHLLQVRARAEGVPSSLDATPSQIELLVDTVPPEGWFDEKGVHASDRVSQNLQYRADDGPWSYDAPSRLTALTHVQARDEAGNVGSLEFHGRTTNPPAPGGCSCDVSRGGSGGWFVIFLIPALIWRRRVLLLLALGCNQGTPLTKGDFESPLHEIGRYHDVALRGGVFHISAYDDATGDLAYAAIGDLQKPIGWQYVDGIDPMALVDLPGDYRHGISDPGPDVGMYSSIALTSGGDPRIAYYDATNGALKLAAGPHPWKISTVQSGDGKSLKVGLYSRILLDGNDVPNIAFMATGISDGMGGFKSELRLARATGSDPSDESSWRITVVDSTRISCAGLCSSSQACIKAAMVNGMPNGDPAQSTCTATTSDCMPACASGEACISAACVKPLVPVNGDLPDGTGLFTNLLQSKTGMTLVYYDRAQGDLKMAVPTADAFSVTTLDGNDPSTDRGQFASARYSDDGTLHVAYVDAVGDQLLYLGVSGMTMLSQVIDDGQRDDGPHSVGAGAALYINGNTVGVVYQDQLLSDLELARQSNGWTHSPLETGAVGYGFWPHIVSEGGKSWLTQFVYDRGAGDPPGNLVIAPFTP